MKKKKNFLCYCTCGCIVLYAFVRRDIYIIRDIQLVTMPGPFNLSELYQSRIFTTG